MNENLCLKSMRSKAEITNIYCVEPRALYGLSLQLWIKFMDFMSTSLMFLTQCDGGPINAMLAVGGGVNPKKTIGKMMRSNLSQ